MSDDEITQLPHFELSTRPDSPFEPLDDGRPQVPSSKLTPQERMEAQGPWDQIRTPPMLLGAPSLPMPVKIASPESLSGCFNHLQLDGTHIQLEKTNFSSVVKEEPYYNVPYVEYEKGVVYADRRLDLCKMVLGPLNIGTLMDSLENNSFITHFLLGNNIIGPAGSRRIAQFIRNHPDRMDTWYLAGNCIDTTGFRGIVDSIVEQESAVSNIWLKRNPLGPDAAADVARLIIGATKLDTLDLDQTELSDEGVAVIFDKLSDSLESGVKINLRHIYLNAVGIGLKASRSIGRFLASPLCQLESLFLANNVVGDEGAALIASGLARNQSLLRFMAASTGLTASGAKAIFDAVTQHPRITALDVGQSFATGDLDGRYNWIGDDACLSLTGLIKSSNLRYLIIDHLIMGHPSMNLLYASMMASPSLCFVKTNTISATTGANEVVRARLATKRLLPILRGHLEANVKRLYNGMAYQTFDQEERRWLASPRDSVRKIDSVYRNRDAGKARRGLMKLNKWWQEGDGTLDEVMAS